MKSETKKRQYKVVDGFTVTGCPEKTDRFVGGFACAMCEHWRDSAVWVSGPRYGDPGVSFYEIPCAALTSDNT